MLYFKSRTCITNSRFRKFLIQIKKICQLSLTEAPMNDDRQLQVKISQDPDTDIKWADSQV